MIPFYIQLIFAGLFGLAIGSFLNVCIYRIPAKKSIVNPPSSCPACGSRIRFYDNIPVISYIILLGRCRHCKERISIGYPVLEIITGLLSMALYMRYNLINNNIYHYFIFLIFTSSLIVISFIDLKHQIIPDVISIPGIIAGLIISFFSPHITWYDSLLGIAVGGGLLYLFALIFELLVKKEGMGGGDIKLLAMMGAWMGWKSILFIILVSSLIGSILGTIALLLSKKGLRARIPFGPFLALGALIYLFFGKEIITWYFNLLSF